MSCTFLFPSFFVKFSKKSLAFVIIGTLYCKLLFHYIGPQGPCRGGGGGEWEGWLSFHDNRL